MRIVRNCAKKIIQVENLLFFVLLRWREMRKVNFLQPAINYSCGRSESQGEQGDLSTIYYH